MVVSFVKHKEVTEFLSKVKSIKDKKVVSEKYFSKALHYVPDVILERWNQDITKER